MAAPGLRRFPDRDALVRALTETCRGVMAEALEVRGAAHLALSGGSTPEPLYRALAQRKELRWSRVVLALVDERWVSPGHEASNEGFLTNCFAGRLSDGASLAPMVDEGVSLEATVPMVDNDYRRLRPFDIVVLGMGVDGHTASWFPRAEGLAKALDPEDDATVAAIRAVGSPVAGPYLERMTLTRPAIAEAYLRVLMIMGADKRAAYERAAEPGREEDMPVRALWRAGSGELQVFWVP
jgi:6-phosphogluconolactonase